MQQQANKKKYQVVRSKEAIVKPFSDPATSLAKIPPSNLELEEAVLGAVMLEKNALNSIIEFLKPEHFYDPRHEVIFESIVALFTESNPVDMRTVVVKLRAMGKIEMAGGAYRIAELTSKVSSAANIEYHARIIIELAIKRKLITIASTLHADAHEDTKDVFELLDKAEQSIFDIAHENLKRSVSGVKSLLWNAIQAIKQGVDDSNSVPTGFTSLDRQLNKLQPSDLIILAARPSMGKTGLAMGIAKNAAVEFNIPVGVFSLEMASLQLVNRLLSTESEISSEKLKTGDLSDVEFSRLTHFASLLSNAPIFIDDTAALSLMEFRAKARRLKAEKNIKLIIVDYLQLMKGDQNGNREQEIASISRGLKQVAKELDVPILALSQLSRGVENRGGDKRPNLSDLRESGSIEQDADIVMFLYRAEYYKIEVDENNESTSGVAEVIIAKHRNGSTGTVKLKFISWLVKFLDM